MRKITTAIVCSLLLLGCEEKDNKFEEVAPVKAPANTNGAAVPTPAEVDPLPQGHPPIGTESPVAKPNTVRFTSPAEYGKSGPLRWTAPASWQASQPGTQMRLAEYIVAVEGEAAVLSVFYFGAGGGGGVDANVARWVGQFEGGKPKRGEKMVAGMKVHTVDVSGTYNAGMAGGGAPAQDGNRMLGAIVESEAGLFFFKLVGPKAVVGAQEAAWNEFVNSFQKG